jgi:hypothetical protein
MIKQVKALKWVFLLQENVAAPLALTSQMVVEHEQGVPWSYPYD